MGDLIKTAGGQNILHDAIQQWPKISPELVVSRNPQIIITHSDAAQNELKSDSRPGWEQTDAVKQNRVYQPPDQNLLLRPGPRILKGLSWLVGVLAKDPASIGQ